VAFAAHRLPQWKESPYQALRDAERRSAAAGNHYRLEHIRKRHPGKDDADPEKKDVERHRPTTEEPLVSAEAKLLP
jgi:hypothetical protein